MIEERKWNHIKCSIKNRKKKRRKRGLFKKMQRTRASNRNSYKMVDKGWRCGSSSIAPA
jgi:hypothetical protein